MFKEQEPDKEQTEMSVLYPAFYFDIRRIDMDFLTGNIKRIYFRYLSAAFGSAMITSVYSIVDMAMVGQYHGPDGTAALAVVAPVWNIIYSLGLLMGIGGSVIFSAKRGAEQKDGAENQYFTMAVLGSVLLAVLAWVGVLAGGLFNIFGDYFFVFTCDMGIYGAGLATAIGSGISFVVMLTHFFSRKNTLRLVKVEQGLRKFREISVTGFSTFFIDVAMGILTVLFNRQIMQYLGTNALAVYGPIIQVSTFVQCCAYSVGQAAQPIISTNFGAGKGDRIRETLRLALGTAIFFGLFWTVVSMACPNLYVRIFMQPTQRILEIASAIICLYAISFLFLPLNIFSTYYFQAIMKPKAAFVVSVARGCVISGILILLLPVLTGADSIWLAMPITELVVLLYAVATMKRMTKALAQ